MVNKTILAFGCLLAAIFATGCRHDTTVRGAAGQGDGVTTFEDTLWVNCRYAPVQKVWVEQPALPVRILPSETDSIAVKCYVESITVDVPDYRIDVCRSDSVLEVCQQPVNGVSVREASGYLEVYVPAAVKDIMLKTVSGSIDIEGVSADRLRATSVSGGIEIRESQVSDELQLRTITGGVRVAGVAQASRKYHSDGKADGISIEAEAMTGGIAVRRW